MVDSYLRFATFTSQYESLLRLSSCFNPMFPPLSSLSFACSFFVVSFALPSGRFTKDSTSNINGSSLISAAYSLKAPEPPNLEANYKPSISALVKNTTVLAYEPTCFPPIPDSHSLPISDSGECATLIYEIRLSGGQPSQRVIWSSQRTWTFRKCRVQVIPKAQGSRDTFTLADIVDGASILQNSCDTQEQGYRGGLIKVGPMGVFNVAIYGVHPLQGVETVQSIPTNDTISANNPICFSPSSISPSSIINPYNCGFAILQIATERDPHEAARWHERVDWAFYTCTVTLLPRNAESYATLSRLAITQKASTIRSRCVTDEYRFRGGSIKVGRVATFDVVVWSKRQSAQSVEARSNAPAKPLPPISLRNTTLSLGARSPYCWKWPGPLPIMHSADCDQLLVDIVAEGPPDQPILWSFKQSWVFGSCTINLVPRSPFSTDIFYRWELFYAGSRIYSTCHTDAHPYMGGKIDVGPNDAFTLQILGVLHTRLEATNVSSMNAIEPKPAKNNASLYNYQTYCWPSHDSFPIRDEDNCLNILHDIAAEGPLEMPVLWDSGREWTYRDCNIILARDTRRSHDYFTRLAIIQAAMKIYYDCYAPTHPYVGGKLRVGSRGLFTVGVQGVEEVPRPAAVQARTNPVAESVKHVNIMPSSEASVVQPAKTSKVILDMNTTSMSNTLSHSPACWEGPPSAHYPMINPLDCHEAYNQILREGSPDQPLVWTTERRWVSGSCSIALLPFTTSVSGDSFTRSAIVRAALRVELLCAPRIPAFIGGTITIGLAGIFHVAIDGTPDHSSESVLSGKLSASYAKRTIVTPSSESKLELPLPQQQANSSASNAASTNTDNSTQLETTTTCFGPFSHMPTISSPIDCGRVRYIMLHEGPEDEPVYWASRQTWSFGSCNIVLRTKGSTFAGDTFSRNDIATYVSFVQRKCVKKYYRWRGGYVPIGGAGVFDIMVFGRPLSESTTNL